MRKVVDIYEVTYRRSSLERVYSKRDVNDFLQDDDEWSTLVAADGFYSADRLAFSILEQALSESKDRWSLVLSHPGSLFKLRYKDDDFSRGERYGKLTSQTRKKFSLAMTNNLIKTLNISFQEDFETTPEPEPKKRWYKKSLKEIFS